MTSFSRKLVILGLLLSVGSYFSCLMLGTLLGAIESSFSYAFLLLLDWRVLPVFIVEIVIWLVVKREYKHAGVIILLLSIAGIAIGAAENPHEYWSQGSLRVMSWFLVFCGAGGVLAAVEGIYERVRKFHWVAKIPITYGLIIVLDRLFWMILIFVSVLLGYKNDESKILAQWLKHYDGKVAATKVFELPEEPYTEFWSFDFSPDGKFLAVSSPNDFAIQIWDWKNRRIERTFKAPKSGSPEPIKYSPDGKLLAQCITFPQNKLPIRIWNPNTGEVIKELEAILGGSCELIAFAPDGSALVMVFKDTLTVYSTKTWQPIWWVQLELGLPHALSISPDGKFIAIGGQDLRPGIPWKNPIFIVDMVQHAVVRTILAFPTSEISPGSSVGRLTWSPDGRYLAAGAYRSDIHEGPDFPEGVRIFDPRTGEKVAGEPAEETRISGLSYTPNGKYIIESGFNISGTPIGNSRRHDYFGGNVEPIMRIWDGQHQALLQEIRGKLGSVAVTPDSHHFAVGGEGTILIFELK
jgi:hypothetical protein